MRYKLFYSLLLIFLAACGSKTEWNELPNTKLLSVFSWSDTGVLESNDLLDFGRPDSIISLGDVKIQRLDSSRYSIFGGSLPYAVLRAFQGAGYVDIMTFNKSKACKTAQKPEVVEANERSSMESGSDLEGGPSALSKGVFKETGIGFSESGIGLVSAENNVHVWVLQNNRLLLDTLMEESLDVEPLVSKISGRSHLRVFAANDSTVFGDLLMPLQDGVPIKDAAEISRDDLHGNVMYFAFIDRFYDGNPKNNRKVDHPLVTEKTNYWGGDIKGIDKVIETGYLNDLGINSLWISPITRNPDGAWGNFKDPHVMFSGYHGYWPVYNTVVDPRFGTDAELKSALKRAHDSGINVLLDYVAHHVHKEHPIYKQHPDWVTPLYLPDGTLNTERWDDHRLTTWFDTFMPTLDLGRPEIAAYMVDSALFWLKNFEFDGFRHDATKHIPENFTRLLTKKIRSEVSTKRGKNTYQIGETYGDPQLISSYVGSGLLDAQFDFNLYDRMVDVFAFGDEMEKLVNEQNRSLETYGYHHLMGNITGNQDRTRFMSFADGTIDRSTDWMELKRIGHLRDLPHNGSKGFERFGLFYAYQMTAPGIPVVYYGDEFGMTGANDPGNRNPMKFEGLSDQELALKAWVQSCIALRRSSMALMYGDFEWLYHDADRAVIRRTYRNETVITVINRGNDKFRWSGTNGFESYGKLVRQIGNGVPLKDLYTLSPGSALILKFKK